MLNTTERILSNGTHPQGDASFILAIRENNPMSEYHWAECLFNNPGGYVPILNKDWWSEALGIE